MPGALAASLSATAGGLTLVGIMFSFVWCCRTKNRSISRASNSSSSDSTSVQGDNIEPSESQGTPYLSGLQGARCFVMEELNLATKSFSDINLIGYGKFGEVHKGFLTDGMIVAVKRRRATPSLEFIKEVCHMASLRHRNLVHLLGYCQENDLQMLIYEYMPNGSISSHLYGMSHNSRRKLEFKQRLSIAHGAAKGLEYLHALEPPFVHTNFKTSNVLVDEGFIPKVADVRLTYLLQKIHASGAFSMMIEDEIFLDPEVKESGRYYTKSDVYSFGVFLLELASGLDAKSDRNIIEQVQSCHISNSITQLVDHRMVNRFTAEGMKEFFRLILWCLSPVGERRPPMSFVVMELNRIHEKEISLTTITGEGTTTVTLGSQLFKGSLT